MNDEIIHLLVDLFVPVIVTLIAVVGYERLKARNEQKQTEANVNESENTIGQTNISTAMALLDRVRKENTDLIVRAESCEIAASALTDELKRLKIDLVDSQEGSKRLYYQLKSKGETPIYTPPSISGPLISQMGNSVPAPHKQE